MQKYVEISQQDKIANFVELHMSNYTLFLSDLNVQEYIYLFN